MLSFVIAEDLRIETSYPFNEVTAVFLINNPRYHYTSHSDEPLSYQAYVYTYSTVQTDEITKTRIEAKLKAKVGDAEEMGRKY